MAYGMHPTYVVLLLTLLSTTSLATAARRDYGKGDSNRGRKVTSTVSGVNLMTALILLESSITLNLGISANRTRLTNSNMHSETCSRINETFNCLSECEKGPLCNGDVQLAKEFLESFVQCSTSIVETTPTVRTEKSTKGGMGGGKKSGKKFKRGKWNEKGKWKRKSRVKTKKKRKKIENFVGDCDVQCQEKVLQCVSSLGFEHEKCVSMCSSHAEKTMVGKATTPATSKREETAMAGTLPTYKAIETTAGSLIEATPTKPSVPAKPGNDTKTCGEVCFNLSGSESCTKMSTREKRRNMDTVSKQCKKCVADSCADEDRFKSDCHYRKIIGDCKYKCTDVPACDFCYECKNKA